ncbi:MAG: glutamate racemase [Paludibacteraceae bacterium]|nr:glutamate racemase [Paludibacteraceae bacterium]
MVIFPSISGPIGVFDSGYGGLTILEKIRERMPQYDYIYLGDNARTPYGTRSFDVVYEFTKQSTEKLFSLGCPLVILACNTASAKALKTIQTNDLPLWNPDRRVLGVIRPTVEKVGNITKSKHVGIVGTPGTIQSQSYPIEINKLYPDIHVTGQACPMWVPLVENGEYASDGADYFVQKYLNELLEKDTEIDTIILGCTHYPLLINKIKKYLPDHIQIIAQGNIVAESLQSYLQRHDTLERLLTKNGTCLFYTTESPEKFRHSASIFLHQEVTVEHTQLTIKA